MSIKLIVDAIEKWCEIGRGQTELSNLDFEDRVTDPLREHTSLNFDHDIGASKGVLIFPDEDIVIKIPLMAREWDDGEYQAALEEHDRGELSTYPDKADYLHFFQEAENFFIETEHNWDYCELECGIYQEAEKEGLEQYFAKEWWVADVRGYPIYAQIKVQPFCHDRSSHSHSEEECARISKSCRDMEVDCFNPDWIADFFKYYGEEEFKRLSDFLSKRRSYDLHTGNVGYLGPYPILLDYSNYNE